MTAKELFDNLNSTNKKLAYIENLLGFKVERVLKSLTKEHEFIDIEFNDSGYKFNDKDYKINVKYYRELFGFSKLKCNIDDGIVVQKGKKEKEITYFVVFLKDFISFDIEENRSLITIFGDQDNKGRDLTVAERNSYFKTVEEFKTFLEGLK